MTDHKQQHYSNTSKECYISVLSSKMVHQIQQALSYCIYTYVSAVLCLPWLHVWWRKERIVSSENDSVDADLTTHTGHMIKQTGHNITHDKAHSTQQNSTQDT